MNPGVLKDDFLLILTALIWGLAFTAQRAGMEFMGPFYYNSVRFFLGALSLLPVLYFKRRRRVVEEKNSRGKMLLYGAAAGFFIFAGAGLQQIALVYTTAGKAGFITGLYVVLVPVLGLFFGHKMDFWRWTGVALAVSGLYFLSIKEDFSMGQGDFYLFLGSFFWAAHVLFIARISYRVDAVILSIVQYFICSVLSLLVAFVTESFKLEMVLRGWVPVMYGGVFSVGIAYTLQIIAQKRAHPAHAAVILSMESLFAVIGGFFILHERLTSRGILGCFLMFTGMVASQGSLLFYRKRVARKKGNVDHK